MTELQIMQAYEIAKQVYAAQGVDVEKAMARASGIPISMHCWQGDDVIGFDSNGTLTGGIATTGNYPGRASTADELRSDIDMAITLIPGDVKLNLHASYAEKNGKKVDRDAYTVDQFASWLDWAKQKNMGLDFNPTFFSHPMMDGDFSLASRNEKTRDFWVEHGKRCREIGQEFGKQLGKVCVINNWMPDGYKDMPADTQALRDLMTQSLNRVFADPMNEAYVLDSIESKLFGMGVECYTVASHEYSLCYALTHKKLYTLDAGHFHPTEVISAKISAVLQFMDKALLHVSRGVRWDSDHVITWDNELQAIMDEIVRNNYDQRVFIGLDYFDASINRIACWVIGMRNARKALLKATLDPMDKIKQAEAQGDYTTRLALLEETKTLPFGAIWDYYCLKQNVPVAASWLVPIKQHEKDVLSKRS